MRMRGKKPIYNYRDTFSMDATLRPVIKAGLERFKQVLQERTTDGKCLGVPMSMYDRLGISLDSVDSSDKTVDKAFEEWLNVLDKMIIGFSEEPNLNDYGVEFKHNILDNSERDEESGLKKVSIECLTPNRLEEYRKDCKEHRQKALEGRKLFAEYFDDLWW